MKPVRVLLVGAAGRMGKTVLHLAEEDPAIDIVARCDVDDPIEPGMKKCDVAIDFSHPDAIEDICRAALNQRKALVIGTTGHSEEQRCIIERASQSVAIVFASNFSAGVNFLFWLAQKASALLGADFTAEIIETHHKTKKDAPSGTAKTLARVLEAAQKRQIPIQSIRKGEVVGEHRIIFTGPGEHLELTHRATSREIFARGALRAAKWVLEKSPALYSMQDVIGL